MAEGTIKPVVSSRLKSNEYVTTTCKLCKVDVEYIPPKAAGADDGKAGPKTITDFLVRCASCNRPFQVNQVNKVADSVERQKRRYGTGEFAISRFVYEFA